MRHSLALFFFIIIKENDIMQTNNEEHLKSKLDSMKELNDIVAEKQLIIKKLTTECAILQDVADQRMNNFLKESIIFNSDCFWDAWRTFHVIEDIKNGKDVSNEAKEKFGAWTDERKLMLRMISYSIFDDEIIKTYKPELVDILMYCYQDGYEYYYKIGNQTVIFHIPLKFDRDYKSGHVIEDGRFTFGYKSSEHSQDMIGSSYIESEVRAMATEWIKKNCILKNTKKADK